MYKGWNKYIFWLLWFSKHVFVSFFVLFSFLSFSFSFEVKLWDALDKFYDNYKRNSALDDLNWKSIMEDMYTNSLNVVKDNDVIPIFDAIDKTMGLLNKRRDCSLDKQDLINILYYANGELKRDLKNNLIWFTKPQRDKMWKSCNKLNVCKYNPKWWKLLNTVTLNNACQSEANKSFIEYYLNSYYMQTIWWWNEWSNFFWNFTLEDSNYDIMNDVYNLANILFQDVSEPAESRFYKMPKVDYQAIPFSDSINWNIDWFSPYNSVWSSIVTAWISTWENINISWWVWLIVSWTTSLDDLLDDDIIDFVEWTNFDVWWNNDSIVGGNACITWVSIGWSIWYSSWTDWSDTLTPWEYLSGLLWDLETVSCNWDWVYQDWESQECDDVSSSSSTGVSDIEQIEALLNAAQQSGSNFDENNPALWCFQKCESVPCNATSCDKIICYAKCSCILYESDTFNPLVNPWLTSVFKVKFCVVPVMENSLETRKTVYNISAIFTELYKVLQDLRNSGQLSLNVKTKEFLDNWLKENNFGEQLSFSLNSSIKPTFAQASDLSKKQEQTDLNTSWMEGILWFSQDPWLDNEKNKYIVMDDPCEYTVNKQVSDNIAQRAILMEACHEKVKQVIKMPEMDTMEIALKDQKTVLLDSEFESFLRQNRDFWIAANDMFMVWVDSSKSFSEK